MHLSLAMRPLLAAAVACMALAFGLTDAEAAPRNTEQPTLVHGLLVQLRDAPSHGALARERALARDGGVALPEMQRWSRLLEELRRDEAVLRELPSWRQTAPRRDPVGASAQVLRFAQPLSVAQAERVAARWAARPEVAWVGLNTREQRQAVASNAPSDPYFAGNTGQWWLQSVGGSDANAIADRRRGVPGFLPAWLNNSIGGPEAVVAVLDSGISCHPDLGNLTPNCIGGAILPGYDFVTDWDAAAQRGYANDGDGRDADPRDPGDWVSQADRSADATRYGGCEVADSSWHGTVIAGLIAARTDNGVGASGINWNGRVLPVRVAGKCGADVADIIDGMRWAAGRDDVCKRSDGAGSCTEFVPRNPNPARIINISFGGSAACGAAYQAAIDELRGVVFAGGAVGAVVVASAGNGWGAPTRPANCQRVIGVAALNRDGFKTTYSAFGAALALSTVGGDDADGAWGASLGPNSLADSGILTVGNSGPTAPATCSQPGANCYFNHFGTSFSAPIVSGAVSLMLSVKPDLSASQIEQGLARSARPHVGSAVAGVRTCSDSNPGRCLCTTATCGAGILDAAQALLYAAAPATYQAPVWPAVSLNTSELRAAAASGPDRPANAPPPPPAPSTGGGGAMSLAWLVALLLATAALRAAAPPANLARKARTRHPRVRH